MSFLSLFRSVRPTLFLVIFFLSAANYSLICQCEYDTPPVVKKIDFGAREITFSNVAINGEKTTVLHVERGEKITMTVDVESTRKGDYCPGCIVQLYWGIHGYTSVCAKSYFGYNFRKTQSFHEFIAPMEDGVYYITMGGGLDYQCKNRINSPFCSTKYAFAVLVVGDPVNKKEINITKVYKGPSLFLKTELIKSGCIGNFNHIEWFYGEEKLDFDDQREIPVLKYGEYIVKWTNCVTEESLEKTMKIINKERSKRNR